MPHQQREFEGYQARIFGLTSICIGFFFIYLWVFLFLLFEFRVAVARLPRKIASFTGQTSLKQDANLVDSTFPVHIICSTYVGVYS